MTFDEALAVAREGVITREIASTLIQARAGDELDSLLEAAGDVPLRRGGVLHLVEFSP